MRSDYQDRIGTGFRGPLDFIDSATPAFLARADDEAKIFGNYVACALDNFEILAFIHIHAFARRAERYVAGDAGRIPAAQVRTQSLSIELFVLFKWCRERKQNAPQTQRCVGW